MGEDGGGGHWLVRIEWRLSGWSVCLPLLISPYTMKSRSSLLAPADPGGPRKRAIKWFCVCVVYMDETLYGDGARLRRKACWDIDTEDKMLPWSVMQAGLT